MAKDHIEVLYLNINIQSGAEAVKQKISKKLRRSLLPNSVKNGAAQAASDFATPKMVAQMISQDMCRKLPKKMKEKGLSVEMSEVFREGSYVVLQMQVTKVHMSTLTRGSLGDYWFWQFMEFIGAGDQQHFEEDYLPNLITRQLALIMPDLLEEKMTLKKLDAETEVLRESQQARYFYGQLRRIRGMEEVRRTKNPIRKMRLRLSSGSSYDEDESFCSSVTST